MINNLTYNADLLFIEFDDIIESPAIAFVKGARMSGQMREIFDFSSIDSLNDVGLTEWYWFRSNRNPLLDLNPSVDEDIANEILKKNLTDPNFYFLYTASAPLHFALQLKTIYNHKIARKIVIWSREYNKNIDTCLANLFPGIPYQYRYGTLSSVLEDYSKDATYVFSDIHNVTRLHEIDRLHLSSIVLAAYRYNMMKSDIHMLKFDFDEYMKAHKIVFKYAFWNPSKVPIKQTPPV